MNIKAVTVCLLALAGCGPDWGDCLTCRPGEKSVESVDGGTQIPVVVNVSVVVDQTQTQTQTQGQNQSLPQAPVKTCRTVCVQTQDVWVCKNGKITTNRSVCTRCGGVKKITTKCVREETQCS